MAPPPPVALSLQLFRAKEAAYVALPEEVADVSYWAKSVARLRALDRIQLAGAHRRRGRGREVHAPAFVEIGDSGQRIADRRRRAVARTILLAIRCPLAPKRAASCPSAWPLPRPDARPSRDRRTARRRPPRAFRGSRRRAPRPSSSRRHRAPRR